MLAAGDMDGKRVCVRIMEAVEELQRTEQQSGGTGALGVKKCWPTPLNRGTGLSLSIQIRRLRV